MKLLLTEAKNYFAAILPKHFNHEEFLEGCATYVNATMSEYRFERVLFARLEKHPSENKRTSEYFSFYFVANNFITNKKQFFVLVTFMNNDDFGRSPLGFQMTRFPLEMKHLAESWFKDLYGLSSREILLLSHYIEN